MKFSVVVTDYKRKIYILDALRSIKNQEGINLNDLELVVVKYYEDEKIDNYIKQNFLNYKIINLDPDDPNHWVGRTFYEGIKNASNNLIFLLEDDDLFRKNKIKTILEFIKKKKLLEKNTNFLIYNDSIIMYNNKLKVNKIPLYIRLLMSLSLNSSKLTLFFLNEKYKDIFLQYLKDIYLSVDLYTYAFFYQYGRIYFLNKKLTVYRVHDKNVSKIKELSYLNMSDKDRIKIAKLYPRMMRKVFRTELYYNRILRSSMHNGKKFKIELADAFGISRRKIYYYILYKLGKYKLIKKKLFNNNVCIKSKS